MALINPVIIKKRNPKKLMMSQTFFCCPLSFSSPIHVSGSVSIALNTHTCFFDMLERDKRQVSYKFSYSLFIFIICSLLFQSIKLIFIVCFFFLPADWNELTNLNISIMMGRNPTNGFVYSPTLEYLFGVRDNLS